MDAEALHFRVRSSSIGEVYEIEATFSPSVKITCTCQGGLIGQACKHRTALLLKDASALVDVNVDDLRSLSLKAKTSSLGQAMREMASLEAEADRLKKTMSTQKKKIARLLNGEPPSNATYTARY